MTVWLNEWVGEYVFTNRVQSDHNIFGYLCIS